MRWFYILTYCGTANCDDCRIGVLCLQDVTNIGDNMFFNRRKPQVKCFIAVARQQYAVVVEEYFNGEHNCQIKNQLNLTDACVSESLASAWEYLRVRGGPGALKNTRYIFEAAYSAEDFRQLVKDGSKNVHLAISHAYNADDIVNAARRKSLRRIGTPPPDAFEKINLTTELIEKHTNPNFSTAAIGITENPQASSKQQSCIIL